MCANALPSDSSNCVQWHVASDDGDSAHCAAPGLGQYFKQGLGEHDQSPGKKRRGAASHHRGEAGSIGADSVAQNASQPLHSPTPRGDVDSRLGVLTSADGMQASTGRSASFRSRDDAECGRQLIEAAANAETFAGFRALLDQADAARGGARLAEWQRGPLLTALAGRLPNMQIGLSEYVQAIAGISHAYQGISRESRSYEMNRAIHVAEGHLRAGEIPQFAANVHDLAGLQALLDENLVPDDEIGLTSHFIDSVRTDLLVALAPRIPDMPEAQQAAVFGAVVKAFNALPEGQRTYSRIEILIDVQIRLVRPMWDPLVAGVNRLSDLQALVGPSGALGSQEVITDPVKDYVLAALVGRICAMPKDEWPAAHAVISAAIAALPNPKFRPGSARLALEKAEANELLPAPLRQAYEQSSKLDVNAYDVRNLADVKAVLAQKGIGGPPPLPDDTLGLRPGSDGRPGLMGLGRSQPLYSLAMQVGSRAFPSEQRYKAFQLILDAIRVVHPEYHRVGPLGGLAHLATSLKGDDERIEAYVSVLQSVQELRQAGMINAGESKALRAIEKRLLKL